MANFTVQELQAMGFHPLYNESWDEFLVSANGQIDKAIKEYGGFTAANGEVITSSTPKAMEPLGGAKPEGEIPGGFLLFKYIFAPWEGPPLPRSLNIKWPWVKGFILRVKNPPQGAYNWYGSLGTKETSSSWMMMNGVWNYTDDPKGGRVFISVVDYDLQQILLVRDIGPIENGKDYTFDLKTSTLMSQS